MSDIYLVVMEISTSRTLEWLHRHDLQNLSHKISTKKNVSEV